jgi:hypothetical protein
MPTIPNPRIFDVDDLTSLVLALRCPNGHREEDFNLLLNYIQNNEDHVLEAMNADVCDMMEQEHDLFAHKVYFDYSRGEGHKELVWAEDDEAACIAIRKKYDNVTIHDCVLLGY